MIEFRARAPRQQWMMEKESHPYGIRQQIQIWANIRIIGIYWKGMGKVIEL